MHNISSSLLTISASKSDWQLDTNIFKKDPKWVTLSEQVFKRDNYTCQTCGHHSPLNADGNSFLKVNFKDKTPQNRTLNNLFTSCEFCYQTMHLGYSSKFKLGNIVWIPELTQVQINHLCFALISAIDSGGILEGSSQALYASLLSRTYVMSHFGYDLADPSFVAIAAIDIAPKAIPKQLSDNLRYLPNLTQPIPNFQSHISENCFPESNVEDWCYGLNDEVVEFISNKINGIESDGVQEDNNQIPSDMDFGQDYDSTEFNQSSSGDDDREQT